MAEPSPVPPISTFVVRFWQEWSAAGSRWRGRIEHVQSGDSATFLGLDQMLDFVRRIGVMGGKESGPERKEDRTWGDTQPRFDTRKEATTR